MPARMFTIVVAAGNSTRFGTNKLFEKIGNETVLDRSVRIALENSDGVIVVTDPGLYKNKDVFAVVGGGATRSDSVKNGLNKVPSDIEIIAVHDAARPFATSQIYSRGKELINSGAKAAIPVLDVVDTIKQVSADNIVLQTPNRSELKAVQTPQVFESQTLRLAYENYESNTDDAALVEKMGVTVTTFFGDEKNIKITTKKDLEKINSTKNVIRIGTGYDIHPFADDNKKKLILGGVHFEYPGLEGHSDSDAVYHALTDALLSAVGEKDLGSLFPASKDENKNRDSGEFLSEAVKLVDKNEFQIGNISIIINAQKPKLRDSLDPMKKNIESLLSSIWNLNSIISITPKHGEGIGEIGEGLAIAVYVSVLLTK